MSLIDGVGDAVGDFFIAVVVLLVAWFAWRSTSVVEQPLIRAILILQRRTRARLAELTANHQNSVLLNQPPNIEILEDEAAESASDGNNTAASNSAETCPTDTNGIPVQLDRRTETIATEEVLIEAMDSFNNDSSPIAQRPVETNGSNPSAMCETPKSTNSPEQREDSLATSSELLDNVNEISIKLKFINDDQKVVTGSLKEMLGDFKRRHFEIELAAQKLVRLVFNGRVLQPDSQTLERCGLSNNCVVHCLVHQPRPTPTSPQSSALNNSLSIYFRPQPFAEIPASTGVSSSHNEWDLSLFSNIREYATQQL
ncbi:hypothetical protein KM043_002791 [Ampulex compressa]|nr:hypothetical protein KM043_002791 [Ampulex compressa]